MKSAVLILLSVFFFLGSMAQDTSRRKEVNITSTFKPTLKEAAKINFNATPPNTDTSRPRLQYNLPNQNLNFAFQPGSLKPLALQSDTGNRWSNSSFVKAGYGNLRTPYLHAGISFGDGRTAGINLYTKHISSKGKLEMQDYSNTALDLAAFLNSRKNLQWNLRFGTLQERYNKYGFDKTIIFHGDSIATRYQTWRGRISMNNINKTAFGLSYAPEARMDIFRDHLGNSESNSYVHVPLEKSLGKVFAVNLAFTASLSRYKPDEKDAVSNNYFTLAPSILFKKPNVNIQAGIRPAWDEGVFRIFPNLLAEVYSTGQQFSFQVGWTGNLRNSGFQYLAGMNPWIWAPLTVNNTRIEERFAGIKGTIGDHFNYSAKLGYNTLFNQPLFVNDTMTGKSFLVVNEPRLRVLNIGGEVGYTIGEKLSLISNLSINQFSPKENERAWGLLPMEWKIAGRLMIGKDLYLSSTFYAFDGPWSLTKEGKKNLAAGTDLSAGLEFRILENLKLWAQFNNIFNKTYQRWNQYPVYGFNFLGGVVFSFAQKK